MAHLRTHDRKVVTVSPYDPAAKIDSTTLALGLIVVRDQNDCPLAFTVAYAVTLDQYMLVPIQAIEISDEAIIGVTVRTRYTERVLTTDRNSVTGMLLDFGMYILSAVDPEQEAIEVFRQSRLYRTREFWMHMWSGVGHLFSLLTLEFPAANMIILNEKMLVELRYESSAVTLDTRMPRFQESAARYGHFIGMHLGIDELRKLDLGTIIMPNLAVEIFTSAKKKILFPSWMDKTPDQSG